MPLNEERHYSEQSFKCLFDIYKKRVFSYALAISHSPFIAEEITQEVFIKLWLYRDNLSRIGNPDSYIFTMVKNKTLNYLRRAAHESKVLEELQRSMIPGNAEEDAAITADRNRQLRQAITLLPPQRRLVFQLSRDRGLNHQQIANQLHISPNTVKNHLVTAMRFIRKYLNAMNSLIVLLLSAFRF
ncbi:MAG TPA: RNA polymerase sigma-70 factor [Puia sp.]|nr:RNA polymerase sigma-70 factor [Puia sp.]